MRQLVVTDPARSPLWTERSLRRRIEVLQVPFDDAKAAAKALGGSLNDLFVAAAAGGAGAYHRAAGAPVDELRISMPVSTRTRRLGRRQRVHADAHPRAGRSTATRPTASPPSATGCRASARRRP